MAKSGGPFRTLVREAPVNIVRFLVRKFRYFNAVPRMEKTLNQATVNKAEDPPQQEFSNKFLSSNAAEKYSEKDEKLYANLTNIYVKSAGDNKDSFSSYMVPVPTGGYLIQKIDDDSVPIGFFTVKEAKTFVSAHKKDPIEYSVDKLSSLMNIDEEKMKNILTHVKVLYETTAKVENRPFHHYFIEEMLPTVSVVEQFDDLHLQVLESRMRHIAKYQKEVLKLPNQDTPRESAIINKLRFRRNITREEYEEELYYTDGKGSLTDYVQRLPTMKVKRPEDEEFDVFEETEKKRRKQLDTGEKIKEIEANLPKSIEAGSCKIESSKKTDSPSEEKYDDKIILQDSDHVERSRQTR